MAAEQEAADDPAMFHPFGGGGRSLTVPFHPWRPDHSPFRPSLKEVTADRLPTEILQAIRRSLPLVDYLRFPAVCTAWRSASRDGHNPTHLPRGPPWLFTVSLCGTTLIAIDCLSNIGTPKVYRIPLPDHLHGHEIFASIGHCLLLEKRGSLSGIRLFNPFSPSPTQVARLPPSASLLPPDTFRSTDRFCCQIHAVVTDTNSGITLALLSDWVSDRCLAYTRLDRNYDNSDNGCRWIDLTHLMPDPRRFQTAVLYKDDLFCAVDVRGTIVLAVDFSSAPTVADMTLNLQTNYPKVVQSASLVNSGSSLFLVRWMTILCKDDVEKGRGIEVYRLDDDTSANGGKKWVPVKSLGDRSFFIGFHNQSISMSTMDFPELKSNRVYLHGDATTRIPGDNLIRHEGDLHRYHLVYNLEDESWRVFHYSELPISDYHSMDSVWMIPRAV